MGKEKKNTNFLMQGTILGVTAIVTKIIGVAYRVPLTNIMGDEGNGYYGVVFQVYSLALMLTSYSLPMAVSKLVSARISVGQYRNAYNVFKGAMTFALLSGGIVASIVFFGSEFICTNILKMDLSIYALKTLAPCILIVAILGVLRGLFQGYGTMIPTALSQIAEQVVHAIVSVMGAYMLLQYGKTVAEAKGNNGYAPAYAAAGGTLGTVIGALVALLLLLLVYYAHKKTLKKQIAKDRTEKRESKKYIYKILFFTIAPVILSATVYNISNLLDQAIFSNIMAAQGYAEKEYTAVLGMFNGQYDTMTNIPLSLASALAASFMPSLVATIQTGNRKQIHNKIDMVSRFNMLLVIPCTSGFIFLGKPILDLLFYSRDNTIPAMLLKIGGISVVFFCLSTVTNAALQGMDRMMKPVKNAAISLVIHLVALVVMLVVFKWNIYSIVVSKIIFAAAICFLNSRDLKHVCNYVQEIRRTFVIPSICSLIMGGLSLLFYTIISVLVGTKIATVLAICLAVAIYGITMMLFGGINESELKSLPKGETLARIFKKTGLLKR